MHINDFKFKIVLSIILLLIIEILSINILDQFFFLYTQETKIRLISALSTIVFITELLIWKKLTNEFFSPFVVFFLVLFVFCCGQSLGWIFGIEMGERDVWNKFSYGISNRTLFDGLSYSMVGISTFFLGAVLGERVDRGSNFNVYSSKLLYSTYNKVGKLLLLISTPAFFYVTITNILAVAAGGYLAFYDVNSEKSIVFSLAKILSDYYLPCLLLLLISYRKNKFYRNLILFAMSLDVLIPLYIGGRSGAFMSLLGIVLAWHFFVKPFQLRYILYGCLFGYFTMAISNAVSLTRVAFDGDIYWLMNRIFFDDSVVVNFLGELGWNITSICWTMDLVPNIYPFRYGMSYIVSLLTFVPSFCFDGPHPIVTWANLGDWLQSAVGLTSGPGYTMIAESYINFGYFGVAFLIFEGYIIAKYIACVAREHVSSDILGATFQIILIMTVMKPLTRASVSAASRTIFFVIIPLYCLLKWNILISQREKK